MSESKASVLQPGFCFGFFPPFPPPKFPLSCIYVLRFLFFAYQAFGQKVRQFWNHPINANFIARKYVKLLLEKLGNRQVRAHRPFFLIFCFDTVEIPGLSVDYNTLKITLKLGTLRLCELT